MLTLHRDNAPESVIRTIQTYQDGEVAIETGRIYLIKTVHHDEDSPGTAFMVTDVKPPRFADGDFIIDTVRLRGHDWSERGWVEQRNILSIRGPV